MKRVTVLALAALALVAGGLFASCSSRVPPTPGPTRTPKPTATARPTTASPTSINGRYALQDGTRGYRYVPQIAYITESQQVWLENGDGSNPHKLMDGCTGVRSGWESDVLTSGLAWSADGSHLACWRTDSSVLAVKADGSEPGMPFKAGECHGGPRWSPAGDLIACDTDRGYISIRDPSGAAHATIKEDIPGAWAWSPSGTALVVAGPQQTVPGLWRIFRSDGLEVLDITDAYVASPLAFGWSLDGTKIAYPGTKGITVVDLSPGGHPRYFAVPNGSTLDLSSGPTVQFAMNDSDVIAYNFSGGAAFDVARGVAVPIGGVPADGFSAARLSPAGTQMIFVQKGLGGNVLSLADFRSGKAVTIPGSDYLLQGVGPSPQFTFSGDGKRACWTPRPSDQPQVSCAELGSTAARIAVPFLVEPKALSQGDPSVLWTSISPDLTRVAWTDPGLGGPGSSQELDISYRDGSGVARIGATLGALTYSWRPDGLYRAPARG